MCNGISWNVPRDRYALVRVKSKRSGLGQFTYSGANARPCRGGVRQVRCVRLASPPHGSYVFRLELKLGCIPIIRV